MMIFISSGDAPRRRGEGATNVELNYRDSKRVVSWFRGLVTGSMRSAASRSEPRRR
jgi:hypothetical protein